MKQLLILSGKGGTGKTTVASSFVALSGTRAFADCDVDAPNLHLSTQVDASPTEADFNGFPRAVIDPAKCTSCGACAQACRFGAIAPGKDDAYEVDRISCEGCRVCRHVCPTNAIEMTPETIGKTTVYASGSEVFSTAYLRAGSGNSGKLVAEVKRNLTENAKKLDEDAQAASPFAVVDGSPGIGCPVIASLAKVAMVLVVAEPSASGISDLERLHGTVARLRNTKLAVCVNKADLDPACTARIQDFCAQNEVAFVGALPFDHMAAKAVSEGEVPVEGDGPFAVALRQIYERTVAILLDDEKRA